MSQRNALACVAFFGFPDNQKEETPLCPRKQPSITDNRLSIIRMPRITTVKQPNTMRPDTTRKRHIMHIPQGGTRFTPDITPMKLPNLTRRNMARSRQCAVNG